MNPIKFVWKIYAAIYCTIAYACLYIAIKLLKQVWPKNVDDLTINELIKTIREEVRQA